MMPTLEIYTLALDAMPFITFHLPAFERLSIPWHWTIAEGAAMNVQCTKWCRPQEPRLSRDGTTEYLTAIRNHPRITVLRQQMWDGKVSMVNACTEHIVSPSVVMQVDADEHWESAQLEKVYALLKDGRYNCARFYCVFYLGPNIVATGENCYGANRGEWLRAFYHKGGGPMRWLKHEPPQAIGINEPSVERCINREATRKMGLVFRHYSYFLESQVKFKSEFYGYENAVDYWRKLQRNTRWPVKRLQEFFPWVDERAGADLLIKK